MFNKNNIRLFTFLADKYGNLASVQPYQNTDIIGLGRDIGEYHNNGDRTPNPMNKTIYGSFYGWDFQLANGETGYAYFDLTDVQNVLSTSALKFYPAAAQDTFEAHMKRATLSDIKVPPSADRDYYIAHASARLAQDPINAAIITKIHNDLTSLRNNSAIIRDTFTVFDDKKVIDGCIIATPTAAIRIRFEPIPQGQYDRERAILSANVTYFLGNHRYSQTMPQPRTDKLREIFSEIPPLLLEPYIDSIILKTREYWQQRTQHLEKIGYYKIRQSGAGSIPTPPTN